MKWLTIVALVAAFAQTGPPRRYETSSGEPTLDASISARSGRDIEVPATADGMLTQLPIDEGDRVSAGTLLATIDHREAQAAVKVQENSFEAARQRADDDVEKKYAEASKRVADADLEKSREANKRTSDAVTVIEIMEKELVVERARLQIEKAEKDKQLAILDTNVKDAELNAAKVALERRTIKAPFEAHVQELFVQRYEWVRAGDPILRLANFDVLNVTCNVPARDFSPAEIANRPVTVRVQLPRGRETAIQGRVTSVSQEVTGSGDFATFAVQAEIANQQDGEFWLVQPGRDATMTIHVNETAVAAPANSSTKQR